MILSCLLSLVLILPTTVGSIHIAHHEQASEACHLLCEHEHGKQKDSPDSEADDNHDCTTCPVCQFILSYFTETLSVGQALILPEINDVLFSFYPGELHDNILPLHHRRGPPVV